MMPRGIRTSGMRAQAFSENKQTLFLVDDLRSPSQV
jgi:hypothetical protein